MIQTDSPNRCCGCLACSVVCPRKCIERVEDAAGFVTVRVDVSKCVQCGLCEQVCPLQKDYPAPDFTSASAYGAYASDNAVRGRASSGGMFETIAKTFLEKGGSVFGCKLDENLQLRMHEATTLEQVQQLTKSKYIQSDCHDSFPVIKARLQEEKHVLVCATPCQIAALKNYLGELANSPRLFLLDFFCHGVPSQRFFDKCCAYIEKKLKGRLLSYEFRFRPPHATTLHYVCYQYQTGQTTRQKVGFYFEDPFYLGFEKYITLRDSCYHCPFGTGNHAADITLGDLHEAETYWPEKNRYEGVSKVIINTPKGQALWVQIKGALCVKEFSLEKLRKDKAAFAGATPMPVGRAAFVEDLKTLPLEQVIDKWLNPRKEWKKAVYYRLPDWIRNPVKKICLTARNRRGRKK